VNEAYCREHGIAVVQRKSGGGCVYADEGNLMISLITPDTHSEAVFERFLQAVADVLRALGLPAVTTAHNDILVDGRKVSGNACYALPNATIVHGTLLYDVNLDALERAITPSEAKLSKHAVQSVRQRVLNIRPLLPQIPDIAALQQFFIAHLSSATVG
jgi:lipoic acid synthetase/lipoate-protein ligase A